MLIAFNKIGQKNLGRGLGWIPLMGSLGIAIGYAIIFRLGSSLFVGFNRRNVDE